jgi:hypothetical protein
VNNFENQNMTTMQMQKLEITSPEAKSADLVEGNIEQLKALFPELITDSVNGVAECGCAEDAGGRPDSYRCRRKIQLELARQTRSTSAGADTQRRHAAPMHRRKRRLGHHQKSND